MTTTLVTGLVRVGMEADSALKRIMALGYGGSDVSVIMSEETRKQHFQVDSGPDTAAATGAGLGMAVGSAFGAIVAACLVGATFLIPGVGWVVAGPIAAALIGVSAGGATGGAIGTLIGAGIPEQHARLYETGLASGMIVIGVHARSLGDTAKIEAIFNDLGASQVQVVLSSPISASGMV